MKTAFLFPGQGAQSIGMGLDLFQEFDFARDIFDMADEIAGKNISKLCFEGPMEALTSTINLQPAITAVNLAFLAAVEREGVTPDAAAGHSLGEYGALSAAGVISNADAFRLVCMRGELMHRESTKHNGTMHAIIGLPIGAVEALLANVGKDGVVSVANHNTEDQIVITGSPEQVEKVSSLATSKGARRMPLKVSGAWHSALMRGAEDEFRKFLDTVSFRDPRGEIVFNVSSDFENNPAAIKTLMAQQLCSPVRWYDSMLRLIENGVEMFVEIGPGKVLSGLLKKILPKDHSCKVHNVNSLKNLERFLADIGK